MQFRRKSRKSSRRYTSCAFIRYIKDFLAGKHADAIFVYAKSREISSFQDGRLVDLFLGILFDAYEATVGTNVSNDNRIYYKKETAVFVDEIIRRGTRK